MKSCENLFTLILRNTLPLPNFAKPLAKRCLILSLLLILPLAHVFAADIEVDATCSLDQAIKSANAGETRDPNTDYGDCETGDAPDSNDPSKDGADTITITQAGTTDGTITLGSTPARIDSIITIEGGGFTISGNSRVRVLYVGTSGNLTINNVTIEDGSAKATYPDAEKGGGIYSLGILRVNNSTIRNNTANYGGGIAHNNRAHNFGSSISLSINNSRITGNSAEWRADWGDGYGDGGGIYLDLLARTSKVEIRNSIIHANSSTHRGGGIFHRTQDLTIENSIISNNSAWHWGGGLYVSPHADTKAYIRNSTITGNRATGTSNGDGYGGGIAGRFLMELTHVTIVNNTAKREGGGLHLGIRNNDRDEKAGATFHIRNSILANNSQGNNNDVGNDCDRDERGWATNVGNLIENPGDCGAGDALRADPLLGSLTGSPGYYPLLAGSPAIDAASSAYCTRKDQRGQARRITDCDIGAYEWSSGLVYAPKPPVRSIIALLPEIEVSDLTGFTEAQRIDAEGVGIQSVIDRGIVDAVDVWGFMGAGTRVCFLASGGSFSFLNAATSPRTVSSLPLYIIEGKTCTFIDGPGSVVLHPGAAPEEAAVALNGRAWGLSNCMVTTNYILNLRDAPGGEVTDVVPYDVTLTALSRTAGWFEVDYHGVTGWISADYVTPNGDCGQA